MLGLAVFHKTFNNIGKKKKIIYSISLVTLLVFCGFMGIFIHLDKTSVLAYPDQYGETFEGDTGEPDPSNSGSWYTFAKVNAVGEYNVTTDQAHGGTQSWNLTGSGAEASPNPSDFYLNFTTTPNNYTYVNFSYYILSSHEYGMFNIRNITDDNTVVYLLIDHPTYSNEEICCRVSTTYYHFADMLPDTWCNVSIQLNYTTHKYKVWHDNGTLVSTADADNNPPDNGWLPFFAGTNNGIDQIKSRNAGDTTGQDGYIYIDDIVVEHTGGIPPAGNPEVSLSGLTSGAITFSGAAGETVWCNNSGPVNETMNVSITDGSSNVTWINVSLFDVSDGGSNILDAEDFNLSASSSESTGFFSLGAFPNGGGNITLSYSTWTGANNPFNISTADNIYLRFCLHIDEGEATGTYNVEAAACKVWIGG